jgi:hypothetical protein
VRRLIPPLVAAVLLAVLAGAAGLRELEWSDYEQEALPAVQALTGGDLAGFVARAPAYGGSLLLRAPFALAADAAGGGADAVWRALAAPALLAVAGLGLVLWSVLARAGRPRAAWAALALAVLHPTVLRALEYGHPEEVVGGTLCAAGRGARAHGPGDERRASSSAWRERTSRGRSWPSCPSSSPFHAGTCAASWPPASRARPCWPPSS